MISRSFATAALTGGLFFLVSCASAQQVQSVFTTADLTQTLQSQPAIAFTSAGGAADAAQPVIVVDETARFQLIDGFGGSITDGAAYLLQQKLTPAVRSIIMTRLFSPEKGIGLSFLRQPIGSEDLSRHHFTFDDVSPGATDPALAHFTVPPEQAEIFATLREALRLNPAITVMATPWSPPAWMKTGDTMNGGELLPQNEPVYASYLTRAIESFKAAGIAVKYLTVQNEPLNGTPHLASTYMGAAQAARFIGEDLGPALRRAGLPTQVLAYDHNWDHPEYPLAVLDASKAAPFVAGSALHCYGGDVATQNEIHAAHPEKGIWLTECSGGTWDKQPALIKTARLLIESTRDWAKAVSLWGLVLDADHGPHDGGCDTCRPLVTLDLKQQPPAISYTGDFYGLAHASRFVHPGAAHIGSTSFGSEGLQTVAFQNQDKTIALLVLNNGAQPATFAVQWHGRSLNASLPGLALATYSWSLNDQ